MTGSQACTVLLAEDNEAILETLAECLTIAGYAVLTACDGAEAVDIFVTHQAEIAIAILDVAMPPSARFTRRRRRPESRGEHSFHDQYQELFTHLP